MKTCISKINIVLVAFVVFMGMTIGPKFVHAGDNELGVNLAYSTVKEDGLKNGFGFGINYARVIVPTFAIEAAFEYKKFEIEDSSEDITSMPIRFTGQYRFAPMGAVRPWVGAGVGYYLNDISADPISSVVNDLNATCDEMGLDCTYSGSSDLKNSFGFHLGGGMDYLFNENVALSLGIEYRIVKADFESSVSCAGNDCVPEETFSATDKVDLGGIDAKIGVKYLF